MQVYWIKQTSNQNSQKWPLNLAEVNLCFLRNRQRSDGRNTQNWLIEWNMHVIERHNEVHVGRLTWQTLHVSLYTIHVCCKQYCCITCIRQLKFQIKHMSLSSICYLLNLWETCLVPENIHAHSKEVYWKSQESWGGRGIRKGPQKHNVWPKL